MEQSSSSQSEEVVYATLVNLGGNQDGDEETPQVIVPSHDLSGHEMVSFAAFEQAGITSEMIQHAQLTSQQLQGLQGLHGIEYIQTSDGGAPQIVHVGTSQNDVAQDGYELADITREDIGPHHDASGKERDADFIEPPVPKGPHSCNICSRIFTKWSQLMRHIKTHEDDQPFRCDECSLAYNVERNLAIHKALHREPLQCPLPECADLRFRRLASLKNHLTSHMQEESLICSECGDEFGLQSQLDRHLAEHRQEQDGIFECANCKLDFKNMTNLKSHMQIHMKIKHNTTRLQLAPAGYRASRRPSKSQASRNRKCTFCAKRFAKPSQLERHLRIHTGVRPFSCKVCKKSFTQKAGLQLHEKTHHELRPYPCHLCPMRFSQQGNLRNHVSRAHNSENNEFRCTECSCAFKRLGALNAHISRVHTNVLEQELVAAGGLQSLTRGTSADPQSTNVTSFDADKSKQGESRAPAGESGDSDIVSRALDDSGMIDEENPQPNRPSSEAVSQSCGRTDAQPANEDGEMMVRVILSETAGGLKRNTTTVRKIGGVRWHQCHFCTKEFKKPSDLVRHIRIHTNEKPFKCNQCARAFSVQSTLTAHLRTHTGARDYKCHVCQKSFSTPGSLKIHMRLHTGDKPFDCNLCGKKFRTSGHLKSHQLSHCNRTRKTSRPSRLGKPDLTLHDIPWQEPIVITDSGLVQHPPRYSQLYQQITGETGSERPHKCNYCSHAFKKSSHLKQHIRSHTGEKPYRCVTCQRSFVSSGVLKAHMKTHTGQKEYKCLLCDSLFTTNGSLKRHLSTHTEARPFMCPYCQKTFKTSVNCKKHMKTHKYELVLMQQQGVSTADSGLQTLHAPTRDADEPTATSTAPFTQFALSEAADEMEERGNAAIIQDGQISQFFVQPNYSDSSFIAAGNQAGSLSQLSQFSSIDMTGLNSTNFSNILTTRSSEQTNLVEVNQNQDMESQSTNQIRLDNQSTNQVQVLDADSAQLAEYNQSTSTIHVTQILGDDGEGGIHCKKCSQLFRSAADLDVHLRREHEGSTAAVRDNPLRCKMCDKLFETMAILKQHDKTHGAKVYQCELCDFTANAQAGLNKHLLSHVSRKTIKCPQCGQYFATTNDMVNHQQIAHAPDTTRGLDVGNPLRVGYRTRVLNRQDPQTINHPTTEDTTHIEVISTNKSRSNPVIPADAMSISHKVLKESTAEKDRISEVLDRQKLNEKLAQLPKHAHTCPQCPRSFKKPSDLIRHMRTHTGEKPYACDQCDRSFTVKSTLVSHHKTHFGPDKVYTCHVCQSPFATKGTLKVHMRIHTGAKPYKCPRCDARFRTSGHRKTHVASHYKLQSERRGRKPVTKPSAQTNWDTIQDGGDAENAVGGTPAGVLNSLEGVQILLNTVGGQGTLHITGLDPNILGPSMLPIQIDSNLLAQLQAGTQSLNITLNPVGGQSLNLGQLTDSGGLTDGSQMDTSSLVQLQPDTELIQVDDNGEETSDLQLPTQSSQVEDLVSGDPGSSHSNPEQLVGDDSTSHILITNPLSLQCQTCGKAFQDENMLAEHLLEHDLQTSDKQLSSRALSCDVCGKKCDKPSQLDRHIRVHTGEKPFVCEICNRGFSQKNSLQVHMTKHTGDKPFSCPVCNHRFTQKGNMKTHMKRSHGHVTMSNEEAGTDEATGADEAEPLEPDMTGGEGLSQPEDAEQEGDFQETEFQLYGSMDTING